MVNIFEELELGVSIGSMIAECTGYTVEKGDLFPQTICAICLQEVENAFDIKKTYERSSQLYSEMEEDLQGMFLPEEKDLSDKENELEDDADNDSDYFPSDEDPEDGGNAEPANVTPVPADKKALPASDKGTSQNGTKEYLVDIVRRRPRCALSPPRRRFPDKGRCKDPC